MNQIRAARMGASEVAQHDAIIVLIDLEPDDMVAIIVFLDHLMTVPAAANIPLVFVTGEGKRSKIGIMAAILDAGGFSGFFKNITVMDGHPSDKDYPDSMYAAWGAPNLPRTSPEAAEQVIRVTLDKAKNPFILCLKPPRELVHLMGNTTHATMAIYGSFNLRSLWADPKVLSTWLHESFAHVLLYETFLATGEQNSVSRMGEGQRFWDNLVAGCGVSKKVLASVEAWNFHILDDCLESIRDYAKGSLDYHRAFAAGHGKTAEDTRDYSGSSRDCRRIFDTGQTADGAIPWDKFKNACADIKRNLKIVDNITASNGMQMVMADIGLVAALFGYIPESCRVPCAISFTDRGYTVATPKADSTVIVVKDVGYESAVIACTRMLPF
jgi:hypothetical protein